MLICSSLFYRSRAQISRKRAYFFGKPQQPTCASQDSFWDIRKNIGIHVCLAHEGGPLRFVCGQTVNTTAMIYTSVHLGKHFALFGRNRRNWRQPSRHKKQRNLLFVAVFYVHLLHLFAFGWHTGLT